MTTEFILVRHGQTTSNLTGTLQGQRETELDAVGIQQAHAVAAFLKDTRIDHIISSDLKRAADTAAIIAEATQTPVTQMKFLREWDLGALQGMPLTEVAVKYPNVQKAFHFPIDDCEIPAGETFKHFHHRVSEGMEELARQYPDQTLAVVTHAGVLRNIFQWIFGSSERAMLPATNNASCSRLLWKDGVWRLCVWNDTSFLANIGSLNSTAL